MPVLNNGLSKISKAKLIELQGEINKSTITVGSFNALLSLIDRSSRQKISEGIVDLKNTISQSDLIDFYRLFHLKREEYIFSNS